ncbi:MAG: cysteine peptidase family C39 domain-containing protein, partial [Sedimentisphaerales bacterium]
MKTKHFVLTILCLFSVSGIAFGDRQLERAEILQILQKLTSQPRKTWISAGTIEAIHEEYRAPKITNASEIGTQITTAIQEYQSSPDKLELTEELQKMRLDAIPFNVRYRLSNELTMNSTVVVKFDGNRFYWEINVDSRRDSIKPNAALEDNFMTKQFNLEWNARRIFSWDGQKYTMYSLPANQAMVDTTNSIPHVVNGPLTAGFIPWGYGLYTYKNLSAATFSATEMYIEGQTQIHLTLNNSDGSEMSFVLDAGRNYAVISHSTDDTDKIISRQYDDYRLVSGVLVPMTILIEQYDTLTNRLLATDFWDITSISGDTPSLANFSVDYEPDALIEYRSDVTNKPALYRYSYTVDSDQLLTERLDYAASEGIQAQNCATAALKYAASQLGKDLTYRQLAQLADRPTSLDTMKDFVQRSGLYCRAVRTDVQTLKGLSGCQVILHFPKKNHFVALEGIDDEYAWSVDLSKDKFYYRTDLNFLDMDWAEGTA